MPGKMHELLAVESDLDAVASNVMKEAEITFTKKASLFQGTVKTYKPIKDTEDQESIGVLSDSINLETTVPAKLGYVADAVGRFYDAALQKEATNQTAKADLIVDGTCIAKDVPATFLLGLEKRLVKLRGVYSAIPTLAPGKLWEPDAQAGEGVFKTTTPERKYRTAKTIQHKILYEATTQHRAEIERWEENENVGVYEVTSTSGMLSTADKSTLLGRVDHLLRAVKQARQRANNVDVVTIEIGATLFKYINKGAAEAVS